MLKRTLSQIKDQSLRQMYFLVAPYEVIFGQPDENMYILQLEKGYQIIGSLRHSIENIQNKDKIQLRFHQNIIKFRLFSQKNVSYQWSLYKRIEQSEQMIQTKIFNLKQTFKKQNKNGSFDESVMFESAKIQLKFYILRASSPKQLEIMILNKRRELNLYDQDFPFSQVTNYKKSTKTIKFILSQQQSNRFSQRPRLKAKKSNNTQKSNKSIQEHNSFIVQAKIIQQQSLQIQKKNKKNENIIPQQLIQNINENSLQLMNKQKEETYKDIQILSSTKQPLAELQLQNDFIEQPLKLKDIIQQNQNQNISNSITKQQMQIKQNNYQNKQQIIFNKNLNNKPQQILVQSQNHDIYNNLDGNNRQDLQINLPGRPFLQISKLQKEYKQQNEGNQSQSYKHQQFKQTIQTNTQQKQIKITSGYSFKAKAFIFIVIIIIISLVYTFLFLDNNSKQKKQTTKKKKNSKPEKAKSQKTKK